MEKAGDAESVVYKRRRKPARFFLLLQPKNKWKQKDLNTGGDGALYICITISVHYVIYVLCGP